MEETECPCCHEIVTEHSLTTLNGHTMCRDCVGGYENYLYEQFKDRKMMEELNERS